MNLSGLYGTVTAVVLEFKYGPDPFCIVDRPRNMNILRHASINNIFDNVLSKRLSLHYGANRKFFVDICFNPQIRNTDLLLVRQHVIFVTPNAWATKIICCNH